MLVLGGVVGEGWESYVHPRGGHCAFLRGRGGGASVWMLFWVLLEVVRGVRRWCGEVGWVMAMRLGGLDSMFLRPDSEVSGAVPRGLTGIDRDWIQGHVKPHMERVFHIQGATLSIHSSTLIDSDQIHLSSCRPRCSRVRMRFLPKRPDSLNSSDNVKYDSESLVVIEVMGVKSNPRHFEAETLSHEKTLTP